MGAKEFSLFKILVKRVLCEMDPGSALLTLKLTLSVLLEEGEALHDVPVQLRLLHFLHQPQHAPFEVGLEAHVVLEDQRLVHLHVHHLRGGFRGDGRYR